MSDPSLRPVTKQSAETQVAESLREFILSGALAPGARLTEVALSDRMGVARSTLRTGLHRLANEGIVVQTPYTGWHVATLTADDAWELWTLRGSLEGLAARLAAASSDPAAHQAVAHAFDALSAACADGGREQVAAADFGLHRAIVEAAGHRRLAQHYRLVEQQVRLSIVRSNDLISEGAGAILAQHRPIADAILAGDAAQAAHAAWQHNESEGRKLADFLRQPGERQPGGQGV